MPVLQLGDLHVNTILTTVSTAYLQSTDTFIADRVFPSIPTQSRSGLYWEFPRGTYFRTDAERRAPATRAPRTSFNARPRSFLCDVDALAEDIPDQHRAATDSMFDLDSAATMQLTQQMLLRRELIWADSFFKAGVWATDKTGVAAAPAAGQFLQHDATGADPIAFWKGEILDFQRRTGIKPNTLVIDPYTLVEWETNPLILDRIKYTETGVVSTSLLASLFGIPRIFVAEAVYNPDGEVTDDDPTNMDYIYGRHALLTYSPPAPAPRTPAAGYLFNWTGYIGANAAGMRIKSYREEPIASTTIEAEMAYQMKQVAPDLGVFYADVTAEPA